MTTALEIARIAYNTARDEYADAREAYRHDKNMDKLEAAEMIWQKARKAFDAVEIAHVKGN